MKADDLWIGDFVLLRKSGRKGKFVGMANDGRLRIQIGDKIVLARESMIELLPEEKINQKLLDLKESQLKSRLGFKPLAKEIDLHIEKLNPNLVNALPQRIVDFQIKSFESYIEDAVKQSFKFVTIIHGKGTGTLKASIHALLSSMEEVNHFVVVNNGGATEVVFR